MYQVSVQCVQVWVKFFKCVKCVSSVCQVWIKCVSSVCHVGKLLQVSHVCVKFVKGVTSESSV